MASANNKKKGKRIDVYMTDSDFELLCKIAEEKGISKTEVMRNAFLSMAGVQTDYKSIPDGLPTANNKLFACV